MKEMNKLSKYKSGIITVKIQCHMPEKFINLLWKKGLSLRYIRKESITSIVFDMYLKDYDYVEEAAKRIDGKIMIVRRKGSSFVVIKAKKRITFLLGVLFFICIIYYLSTFIWGIDISTDGNISPYETRTRLYEYGIRSGLKKSNLDVTKLEEKFNKDYDDVMWIKARIQGSSLKISIAGRQSPPNIVSDVTPCDLVALRDGEVVRVYTTAGTAVVKTGDIIKKGQLLIKGTQGKEGMEYAVHSKGDVIAKTFYEDSKTIAIKGVEIKRTGNKIVRYYIVLNGKKIYLKNNVNKFKNYDKIVHNNTLLKKEVIYEKKEVEFSLDIEKTKQKIEKELFDRITSNISRNVKIADKISRCEQDGDTITVVFTVIGEENVAILENVP